MKVKDLLKMDIDIDVIDNYTEECYIAFCGPITLTPSAKRKFSRALNIECEVIHDHGYFGDFVTLKCDTGDDEIAEKNVQACIDLFYSLAGFCSSEDYDKWFIEEE